MFGGEIAGGILLNYATLILITLSKQRQKLCTGAIIAKNKVITASHCFIDKRGEKVDVRNQVFIVLQESPTRFRQYSVIDVYLHPYYLPEAENDIAIIETENLPSNGIPIGTDIFLGYDKSGKNIWCTILGFGKRMEGKKSKKVFLSTMKVMTLPLHVCRAVTNFIMTTICMPIANGTGPCQGDSGGPIICDGKLRGVLSRGMIWGEGCGKTEYALLLYEDVYQHRVWINRIMNKIKISNTTITNSSHGIDVNPNSNSHKNFVGEYYILSIMSIFMIIIV